MNAVIASSREPSHGLFRKLIPSGPARRDPPTAREPRTPVHPAPRGWGVGGTFLVDCLWISNQAAPAGEHLKVEVNFVLR